MSKKFIFIFFIYLSIPFPILTPIVPNCWQVRLDHLVTYNFKKHFRFNTEEEIRIWQNPSKPCYFGTVQTLFYNYRKNLAVGIGMENDFYTNRLMPLTSFYINRNEEKKWIHELNFDIFLTQKTKLLKTNLYTGFEFIQRSVEKQGNWSCAAFSIKLDLLNFKKAIFYVNNKFYYNYFTTSCYDGNRFVLGTNIKMFSNSTIEPYLMLESGKYFLTSRWALRKIIGLRVAARF